MSGLSNLPIKVLYILHNGALGGSQRSLLEMVLSFPRESVSCFLIYPEGRFGETVKTQRLESTSWRCISIFDHTQFSYYRKWRWAVLFRELYRLPQTIVNLIFFQEFTPDLIHLNETTISWMIPLLKKKFPDTPIVVHARAPLSRVKGIRTKWSNYLLDQADRVIAIDSRTAQTLSPNSKKNVIHNGVNGRGSQMINEESQIKGGEGFTVGLVGTIQRMKGFYEFVDAARIVNESGFDAKFLVAGDPIKAGLFGRFLRRESLDIDLLLKQKELINHIEFVGFHSNLESLYEKIDLLCFPTYLEAVGRPVFEAAWFGKPSVVALSDPDDEMFPAEIGYQIKPRDSQSLAETIIFCYKNRDELKRKGDAARKWARRKFDAKLNSAEMLDVYLELLR